MSRDDALLQAEAAWFGELDSGKAPPYPSAEAAMKRAWTHDHVLLVQKVKALEKGLRLPWELLPNTLEEETQDRTWEEERDKLQALLQAKVGAIKQMLINMQDRLQQVGPGEEYIQAVAESLALIETELYTFKETERAKFEQLSTEEQLLTRDLELFHDRMAGRLWRTDEDDDPDAAIPDSIYSQRLRELGKVKAQALERGTGGGGGMLPEVVEFDTFLDRYGDTGGWSAEDHRDFLCILERVQGDYSACVLECCEELLAFSRQDIIRHARWHAEFQELEFRKRAAIQTWKTRKKMMKHNMLTYGAHTEDVGEGSGGVGQEYRQAQREALAIWREERARGGKDVQKRDAVEAARQQQRAQEEMRRRQQYNKARLELYRMQKADEQRRLGRLQGSGPLEAGSKVSAEQWRQIQERNQDMLRRRQELVEAKKKEAQEAVQGPLKKPPIGKGAPRDPARVLKATKSVVQRSAASEQEEAGPRDSAFIGQAPKKATPTWRQTLAAV